MLYAYKNRRSFDRRFLYTRHFQSIGSVAGYKKLLYWPHMELIPVKTRILTPPQDDLYAVLDESLPSVQEGDVILVSSKIVAIHEGRCVGIEGSDKEKIVASETDFIIPREYYRFPLTVTQHTFLGAAGVDECNGGGYYVLLPEDSFVSARNLHTSLTKKFGIQKLGVIITDSHSGPFRYGATGVSLGWWGIEPMEDHRGRTDLFGRVILYERSNLVDGLAAGATVVMGEVDEGVPVVIARGVPRLVFTEAETKDKLLVPYREDLFRVLYERFLP